LPTTSTTTVGVDADGEARADVSGVTDPGTAELGRVEGAVAVAPASDTEWGRLANTNAPATTTATSAAIPTAAAARRPGSTRHPSR
jgi:hypothetical protein